MKLQKTTQTETLIDGSKHKTITVSGGWQEVLKADKIIKNKGGLVEISKTQIGDNMEIKYLQPKNHNTV